MRQMPGPTIDADPQVTGPATGRAGHLHRGTVRWTKWIAHAKAARSATRIALPLVLALATGGPARAQDAQTPLKIGVLAKRSSERCLEKWGPTAEYLTDQLVGHPFVVVLLGYEDVCPAVERGEVDFILANPALYVELERRHGASRVATLKNRPGDKAYTVYGGVIFRRADRTHIETLSDLRGKTFMAVDEASFGGWLAPWRELREHGIDPHRDFADLQFGGTHDAVVYAVRDGKVDAGSVRTDTLERMAGEGKIRLDAFQVFAHDRSGKDPDHVLFPHSTETYPEWPFVSLEHTSGALAERVAVALLSMPADSPAAKAARCAGWTVPLNYQPVHECLKELRAGPYEDYGTVTFKTLVAQYWRWLVAAGVFLVAAAATTLYVLRLNRWLGRSRRDLSHELAERRRAEEAARSAQELLLEQQRHETERVAAELDKLREMLVRHTRLAAIGQMSASIAHELRNPLGAIRNATYYLKRHATDGPPKLAEHLGIIEQETAVADTIIGNLVEMSRARESSKQAVDLGQIVREVLDRANLPEEIRCHVSLDPDPFVLNLDPSQLRQVLGNLLSNAVQAMDAQGEIRVAGRRLPDYDTITFQDSGPGVASELRERLFEPLVTTKAKGIGLGLTICRQIVEQHGGTIELVDDNERGAAFRVRLPR